MATAQNQAPEDKVEGETTSSTKTQAPKKTSRKKEEEAPKARTLTVNGVKLIVKG